MDDYRGLLGTRSKPGLIERLRQWAWVKRGKPWTTAGAAAKDLNKMIKKFR
jgi:hypothetical protein